MPYGERTPLVTPSIAFLPITDRSVKNGGVPPWALIQALASLPSVVPGEACPGESRGPASTTLHAFRQAFPDVPPQRHGWRARSPGQSPGT